MRRDSTLAIGRAGISLTIAPPARKPFSLEPSATAMEATRARAKAARIAGRGGPSDLTVDIVGEIDAAMVDHVEGVLRTAPYAHRLVLSIDSHGGEVAAARRIHRAIRLHPAATKQATISGQCSSAAVLVLAAADFRKAHPNASILMHQTDLPPSSGGRWTSTRYARNAAALQALDDQFLDVLVERTGAPRAVLAKEEANERKTPLNKALAIGLLHEIDGQPSRCHPDWPQQMRAVLRGGAMIGLPSHYLSNAFAAACAAASRGT